MKKIFVKLFVFAFATGILFLPGFSFAHNTGASWEKVVGEYKIDIGYDPATITVNSSQHFDFNIFNSSTGQPVSFSDVWVRIFQDQQTFFASGIKRAEFGAT